MQNYDAIENGIANNDVKALREAIGSIIYTNRDFSNGEFFEVMQYVESKGIQLKDPALVGSSTISSQKNEFTDEDFAKAIFELKKNFCDERIEDVKVIGKKLYGKKKTEIKPVAPPCMPKQPTKIGLGGKAGTNPKSQSHQQKNTILMTIGLVAVIVIIIMVILLVTK